MLLSQRIQQLSDDTNETTEFSDKMVEGFRKCMEEAELLEKKLDKLKEIKEGVGKFYDNKNSDLCDIGEFVAMKLGYL